MSYIHITTFIEAPVERVFHLSRSIRLHQHSMAAYREEAIQQPSSGLINLGETITWKAKHLFKVRFLKIKVTAMQAPFSFVDEQVLGDFKSMKHEHFFKPVENGTIMIDQFHYTLRYGKLGSLINGIFLKSYLHRLLEERNRAIKKAAETSDWKKYLEQN
jgi:ligand-binding SRPBCC domain-containing protein